jgi:type IV pilus assembly protein PilC
VPRFSYIALATDGTTVRGVESGDSAVAAGRKVRDRDLELLQLRVKRNLLQFEITRSKVPRKHLMHFSRQLAAFIKAGIPILDALEAIAEETSDKLFGAAIADMIASLRSGDTFAGAAAAHPEAFPTFYIGMLRSAEVTGRLDSVLEQLSEYVERDLEARRRITGALIYPAVVMAMSVVTVAVLTIFVLPRFKTFFDSLNAKLPLVTRLLIDMTSFLQRFWYGFAGFAALVVLLFALGARTGRGRALRDRLFLTLPGVSELVHFAVLERFCRVLSSMVLAGVPLPEALTVTSEATNNAVFQRALGTAREAMLRGEGLAGPLAATGLFPAAARQMFKVGEETGTLDEQLHTTAVYFDRELEYKIKKFTNLFEPAVIIAMGVVVGFVAIALVSALYGIYRQVKIA